MFKIDDFVGSINNRGVLKSNRYVVDFAPPKYLEKNYTGDTRLLSLRCETANLPGMAFTALNNVPRLGYGAPETVAYGVTFDNFALSFLLDARARVHEFFYEWSNSIVNYRSLGQSAGGKSGQADMSVYEVGYKDKYVTDINITVYDTDDTKVMECTAYRSYPIFLPTMQLGWGSNDDLIKMNVEFTCTDFAVNYSKAAFSNNPLISRGS